MKENQKKAADKNIDSAERALLMQLIEEDGKRLKSNLEKQKEINKKFHFNPDKYVSDLLEKMKKAIEKGNKGKGAGSSRNPDNLHTSSEDENSDSDSESSSEDDDNVNNGRRPGGRKEIPTN